MVHEVTENVFFFPNKRHFINIGITNVHQIPRTALCLFSVWTAAEKFLEFIFQKRDFKLNLTSAHFIQARYNSGSRASDKALHVSSRSAHTEI